MPDSRTPPAGPRVNSTDTLLPLVYDQLRALADSYLKHGRGENILEPGSLVHGTDMRLIENPPETRNGTGRFFAVAACAMRKVLIDHARKRRALKRGFGHSRPSLDFVTGGGTGRPRRGSTDPAAIASFRVTRAAGRARLSDHTRLGRSSRDPSSRTASRPFPQE